MAAFAMDMMDRMADEDEDPTLREGIKYPGKHDVMLGRGGESTYHCGNIAFRQLVEDHKTKYYSCPRAHKSRVVTEVVKKWRLLTPPGRFLTRSTPAEGDKSPWHDVGDGRALKKASHSLRDAVRCFSVEKKHRAQQADLEVAEIPVSTADTRKRSLGSDLFLSSSRVGGNKLGAELDVRTTAKKGSAFFLANTRVANSKVSLGMELMAARNVGKPKMVVAPAFEERPSKRQRVVCDEREEQQDDCRREEEQPVACDERRDCGRDGAAAALESIPSTISWDRPPPAETFSFLPSFFSSNNNHTNVQQQPSFFAPKTRSLSPCGSADWFTTATEDLPVQATSFLLPTADVLVQEVVVSDSSNGRDSASSDDDNSLGWFSAADAEQNMTSFSSAPLFNVDLRGLHKPLAVTSYVSSGRE